MLDHTLLRDALLTRLLSTVRPCLAGVWQAVAARRIERPQKRSEGLTVGFSTAETRLRHTTVTVKRCWTSKQSYSGVEMNHSQDPNVSRCVLWVVTQLLCHV